MGLRVLSISQRRRPMVVFSPYGFTPFKIYGILYKRLEGG